MYKGKLIEDLLTAVARAEKSATPPSHQNEELLPLNDAREEEAQSPNSSRSRLV